MCFMEEPCNGLDLKVCVHCQEAELSLKKEFFLEKSLVVFVFINTREMLEEH